MIKFYPFIYHLYQFVHSSNSEGLRVQGVPISANLLQTKKKREKERKKKRKEGFKKKGKMSAREKQSAPTIGIY